MSSESEKKAVLQAYLDVRSLHGLLHTTYGALILVKTALLLALGSPVRG